MKQHTKQDPVMETEEILETEIPAEAAEETPAEEVSPTAALEEEIAALTKTRDEYLNMAQRVQADFDNFRKRNASVRADALDEGTRKAVTAMLPVLDNMERTLQAMTGMDENYRAGVEMVLRQMVDVLKGLGMEEIPAAGEVFDPNVHEAVMQGPADDDHPSGTVLNVLQKGYKVKDRVIRASMVQVAQ